jgi:hypothetical protein
MKDPKHSIIKVDYCHAIEFHKTFNHDVKVDFHFHLQFNTRLNIFNAWSMNFFVTHLI